MRLSRRVLPIMLDDRAALADLFGNVLDDVNDSQLKGGRVL